MNNKITPSPDSSFESKVRPESTSEKIESKDIKERSREFVEGVSELVEGAAAMEGQISENTGEDKKSGPQIGIQGSRAAAASRQSREIPSIEIMQIQVSTQIQKEIREVEKELSQMMIGKGFSPYKLNDVVSKLRYLRNIFADLAHASTELLKDLWLKYVKNITS